jgi:hypothetical protein
LAYGISIISLRQSYNHKNLKTETSFNICVEEKHIEKRIGHPRFLHGLPLEVRGIIDLMVRSAGFHFSPFVGFVAVKILETRDLLVETLQ